jgi:hypothetical protein
MSAVVTSTIVLSSTARLPFVVLFKHDLISIGVEAVEDSRPENVLRFEGDGESSFLPESVHSFKVCRRNGENEPAPERSFESSFFSLAVVIRVREPTRQNQPGKSKCQVSEIGLVVMRDLPETDVPVQRARRIEIVNA